MLVEYLKKIPLFSHLHDGQLKEIAARCRNVLYKKGDVVFHKTDPGTDLYIVNSGKLSAILSNEEGGEMVLAQFEKGAFFGELSLLDGKGRSATVIADKDSELAMLKQNVFLDLVLKNPRIAAELTTTLVGRIRKAYGTIESLAFLAVGERLTRTLLDGAAEEKAPATGFHKTNKLTHRELAARIGCSREAVSKSLKVLSAKKVVQESAGSILIAHNALDNLKHAAKFKQP